MAGAVQIELTQHLSGKTICGEYVKRKGDPDPEHGPISEEDELKGIKVIQSENRPGTGWTYLDCEDELGIVFKLVSHGKRPQCVINNG
jgi:hypothetical protein